MKYLVLFYLLGFAYSEWVGNLTVSYSNHTFSNFTRHDSRVISTQHGIYIDGFLYSGESPLNSTNFTNYQPLVISP